MSTTIDQRVVEMQFDNRHFESNVATTMSTLDKLKQKLRFDGANKGLEGINSAAKNVNMSGLADSVEAVKAKFSAMDVVGVTALANITNSAVNAGKRIASALTIDPIKTGFQEYETQINAVQTILANTESKGTTIDDVNRALEELNKYADMTIYNFTEMTRNIGTFTAAGVDLDTSTNAIKGIANLAAVSGSTSQQASTAMYQLSQALSSGTVKLMDWNSVVNAGMGGQVFQDALKETARVHGVAIDDMIEKQGSFRETLSDGWLTAEILTDTLQKFTLSTEGLTEAEIEANREMLRGKGYTDEQIEAIFKLGNTATNAATKVKTFTQLWDVLKEAAQSGWSQTWKLLVGDFEQAKALLTPLSETLTGIINKFSDSRNDVLKEALTSKWTVLTGKINAAGLSTEEFEKRARDALTAAGYDVDDLLEKYGSFEKIFKAIPNGIEILKNALSGLVGGAQGVIDKLFDVSGITRHLGWGAVGEDVKKVQDALEKLGYSLERFGVDGIIGPETTKAIKDFQKFANIQEDGIVGPETLAALEKLNTTTKAVVDENGELIISYEDLQAALTKKSGRELLIESFANAGNGLLGIFKALGEAWEAIFPPKSVEEKAAGLYRILEVINKFSQNFRLTYEETNEETGEVTKKLNANGEKLMRTFKGILAVVSMVADIAGGAFRIAFKVVSEILKYFNLNILDVTAAIGDALVKCKEWFDSLFDITKVLDAVVPCIKNAGQAIADWFSRFKESEGIKKTVNYIQTLITSIKDWWRSLKDAENLPKTIAEGIVNFFSNIPSIVSTIFGHIRDAIKESLGGINTLPLDGFIGNVRKYLQIAGQTVLELGKIVLRNINKFLSAHGFQEISEDSIAGLVQGFKDGASKVWNAAVEMVKVLVEKVESFLGIASPSKVFIAIGGFMIAGLVMGLQNGIPDSLGAVKDVFQPMLDWVKSIDFGAILAGVIGVGMMRAFNKIGDSFESFGGIAEGLEEVLEGVSRVFKRFAGVLTSITVQNIAKAIKDFAIAIAILAGTVVVMAYLLGKEEMHIWEAIGVIGALAGIVLAMAAATALMSKASVDIGKDGVKMANMTSSLISIGATILLLALTVKLIGGMDMEAAKRGFIGLGGIVLAIVAVLGACKLFLSGGLNNSIDKIGKTMFKLSAAMLVLVIVAKMIAGMEWGALGKAAIGFTGLLLIVGVLMKCTSMVGHNADKIGGTLLKISIAMGILIILAKMIAGMSWEEMGQAAIGLSGLVAIISMLMLATRLAGKGLKGLGGNMIGLAASMAILAITIKIVADLDEKDILKGVLVISMFGLMAAALMLTTKKVSGNAAKAGVTILAVAVAVGILAIVATLLGLVKLENLAKGIVAVGLLSGMVAAMTMACRGVRDIKGNLIVLVVAIGLMSAAVAGLSFIDTTKLASATLAISMLMGVFGLMTKLTKDANASFKSIIMMTGVIVVLSGVLIALSALNVQNALENAAALSTLMLALSGALWVLSNVKMGSGAWIAIAGIAVLGAVVLELGSILALLNTMNLSNSMSAVTSLSALLVVLTGVLIPLTLIGSILSAGQFLPAAGLGIAIVGIGLLGLVIWELGAILYAMSSFNLGEAMPMVKTLSTLLIVLTEILIPLTAIGTIMAAGGFLPAAGLGLAIVALGLLGLVVWELGAILNAMKSYNLGEAMPMVETLSSLMWTLTGVLAALTGLGLFGASALVGVASMAALGLVVLELGVILNALQGYNLEDSMPTITALSTLLNNLTGVLAVLTVIGVFSTAAVAGVASLAIMIGAIGGLLIAIGALATWIDGLDDVLDKGIEILNKIAFGLGSALGNLVSGFSDGLGDGLVRLGEDLSVFMESFKPFVEVASTFKNEMVDGIRSIAETILILTAANVINGLTSWVTGGASIATFAAQFPVLGQALADFSSNIGTFSDSELATVTCAANAIKVLAEASATIPNAGGLLAAIVGENDLGVFAAQFPILGSSLALFLSNVGTFTEEQVATINCAAQAIKTLAQASSEIPNSGGWLGQIVGENDLSAFAVQFPILGKGLVDFLSVIGTFSDEQVATVDCAAKAIKLLAESSSEIPNSGGWLGQIVGENDLSTFAAQFPLLGKGLIDFLSVIGTFSDEQVSTVNCAANAIKVLAEASSKIPNAGGWLAAIVGDNELGTFATQFPKLGEGLRGLVDNVGTFTAEQVSTVQSIVSAIYALTGLANADLSGANKNLDGFGKDLPAFGENLGTFCSKMPASSVIASSVNNIKTILSVIDDIANANSGALSTFAKDLEKIGKDAIKKFVDAFTSSSTKSSLLTAGKEVGTQVIDGIEAKEKAIETAGKNAANKAVDGVEAKENSMESAGKDLGSGLVRGINAKQTAVYNAGYALGQKAVQGEKDGQASNSPSKLTTLAGKWLGEGLIIGMDQMGNKVYSAGSDLGKTATGTISSTISKIAGMVNTDIDTQPTIRPVLDLTDVKNGASAISSMFGGPSVGVLANVGSISSMMSLGGQNGGNSDIVAAIDKLNKKMDNLGNTNYSINGITYDDGSNIAEAMTAIVRQAKLERRM